MNRLIAWFALTAITILSTTAQTFQLTPQPPKPQTPQTTKQQTPQNTSYFNAGGTDVMAFSDFYPEGHQGGVCVIMNGQRIATNGDIRLEATPGQWQPVPKQLKREVLPSLGNGGGGRIVTTLCYPDSSRHLTGFNPMVYPDYRFNYTVTVEAQGEGILVTVDLDTPVPDFLLGKVGFNLEFFPGNLFGKPWLMDDQTGIYPQQPNTPLLTVPTNRGHDGNFFAGRGQQADLARLDGDFLSPKDNYSPLRADDIIAAPYAVGRKFTSRPDDQNQKLTIESLTGELKLYDGRMNHNNGWFVLRSEIAAGATKGAVRWLITPAVNETWRYPAVVQTSQVGYLTQQPKRIVIETDRRETEMADARLVRFDADGEHVVSSVRTTLWGNFLRYRYLSADFSHVTTPGLYQVRYGDAQSSVFRIDDNVYDRGVWQPVIEYFLPVQMCHARVTEKYRVWHDACHLDDALMAHVGNHIDGYDQRPGLSKYAEGERVPGVNIGGWHDAGDFDLRVESQAGEAYILAMAYEQFHPDIDVTAIDHQHHHVEIHEPDGKNDILQQVENGVLTVVRSYQALGRLYRGIICSTLRQYAMLGDAAAMTDGQPSDDDRWIFTEDNPMRALSTAAQLAGAARVLKGFNDALSRECLDIAEDIYHQTQASTPLLWGGAGSGSVMKLHPAVELYLSTGKAEYLDFILSQQDAIVRNIGRTAWYTARIAKLLENNGAAFRSALSGYKAELDRQSSETPYGVPYRPSIWGAGWDIQRFGFEYYFLHAAYPDLFPKETIYNALNFILGCHPGSNTASFASGVGARSATVAYGLNRADWSYIPGGVVSGTALIRPDFPELLEFPFLWQQTEYVLGGGSSHYMFLVLAANTKK
ncbi:MAG: glycoside hydrolase family 9 protein [Prevotella sp.]|nr:glycoside hydrolase family 9 protein [Prevotella sp.]